VILSSLDPSSQPSIVSKIKPRTEQLHISTISRKMKAAFVLLAIALPAAYCFYLQPNYHVPARLGTRNAPVYKSLGDLFHRLHLASKRCVNTVDESCINGGGNDAGNDEDFLNGGDTPGKRCANLYDESCSNGGINGAGADDDWLHGGNNPGRR
jgi:hypothetical protein